MSLDWPYNYIDAIQENMKKFQYIVIPSDRQVLNLLHAAGYNTYWVYPERTLKEEYCSRYTARGNTDRFLEIFIDHWDHFLDLLENDCWGRHIVLEVNTYWII